MTFPRVSAATKLPRHERRLFIGAYGFEPRSVGWAELQRGQGGILSESLVFRYLNPKGRNLVARLRQALAELGVAIPVDIHHDVLSPHAVEDQMSAKLETMLQNAQEVVVDISAMTKLLILVCLCELMNFAGTVRIVYSEAQHYAPTEQEYQQSKDDMKMIAKFPSRGFHSIIRLKCLSSIRMQGQPVILIAFTSFNEQLVRHMLGTMNPHRLFFINGRPPRRDFAWRERATHEIHKRFIDEYVADNPVNDRDLLKRVASTLHYGEAIDRIDEIHRQFGTHERIICAATGSKMQTVGLFFAKMMHPDIHIEYPTPDSYFVEGHSLGVRTVQEVVVPRFSQFLSAIRV